MRTIEIFSGTASFSKVSRERGHETFTLDSDPQFGADVTTDVLTWDTRGILRPDVAWFSPPCTAFSVASIGANWTGGYRAYVPRTDKARLGIRLVERTLELIERIQPKYFFIENPMGVLRKLPLLQHLKRETITYCQYSDFRMKKTDVWHNLPDGVWKPRPPCKNGDPCHEAAPRGSRTGTQGLKGAAARSAIPPALFHEIFEALERESSKIAGERL